MVVAAFPLIKLVSLGIKQISKPLSRYIKKQAKISPRFSKYFCQPPAQVYHYLDVVWKSRTAGLQNIKVKPLKPEEAADLGAEMIGEMSIVVVAAGTIVFEWVRSNRKDRLKESIQNSSIADLEDKVQELAVSLEEQGARLRELNRLMLSHHSQIQAPPAPISQGLTEPAYVPNTYGARVIVLEKPDSGGTHVLALDSDPSSAAAGLTDRVLRTLGLR